MDAASIVITGASSGIGAALARSLAQPGRALALIGRDAARLEAVSLACQQRGATCNSALIDLRHHGSLIDFVETFDRSHPIDTAILNAGVLDGRRDGEVVEGGDVARAVLETNLLSAIGFVHIVLPLMRARRRGQIALVASLASFIPLPDAPAYSASKAGLLSYGLALREALRSEGLQVTVACPGYVRTAMAQIHRGSRPGEISVDRAAELILAGMRRNKAVVGFPTVAYWLSRLSCLAPESLRRFGMRGQRFHVG